MMFAFAKPDAIRSFRAAWAADPTCAICYWGEAWAWGSYLNEKMDAEDAPIAYAASRKALDLKAKASAVERDYIDALAVRYVKTSTPRSAWSRTKRTPSPCVGSRRSTRTISTSRTLYADALFLLEPRRGKRDINSRAFSGCTACSKASWRATRSIPARATSTCTRPSPPCARRRRRRARSILGKSIPGASHINHMPSHTWNEVGRWGDSVRANLDAVHSDLKADIGEGFAIYPSHNLHMLLYAASMDGQGAIATRPAATTRSACAATRCTRCSRCSASAASTRSSR